jgi:hypothetical protein
MLTKESSVFLGNRPRGPGFDSRHYPIFWVAVGLERGPLSPCKSKWGATWKKSSVSGLENWVRFEIFTAVIMKNGVSGMLHRVALVRTDVSEELSASIIKVTRIGELGTTIAVTSAANVYPISPIPVTLMTDALGSSETSVLTRSTRRKIPEGGILHRKLRLRPRWPRDTLLSTKVGTKIRRPVEAAQSV